jgi:hypothetical protein
MLPKEDKSLIQYIKTVPLHLKLILDLFDNNNKRFNVKFEIIENLVLA